MPHHRSTSPAAGPDPDDPFYAPTNLATRLRTNPQPRTRPDSSVSHRDSENRSSTPRDHGSGRATPANQDTSSLLRRPPQPPPPSRRARGDGAPHAPTGSLGVICLSLILVLFMLWRGAASGSAVLAAENARLVEERGQFVVSLLEWGQRLTDADPAWLPAHDETLIWSYGYTKLDPLLRPPLTPLLIKVHEAAFSPTTPLDFPPPHLVKLRPHIIGIKARLVVDSETAEVPRYGWWRATELLAIGGERVVLQAVPPPVTEVEYRARVFYFVPS